MVAAQIMQAGAITPKTSVRARAGAALTRSTTVPTTRAHHVKVCKAESSGLSLKKVGSSAMALVLTTGLVLAPAPANMPSLGGGKALAESDFEQALREKKEAKAARMSGVRAAATQQAEVVPVVVADEPLAAPAPSDNGESARAAAAKAESRKQEEARAAAAQKSEAAAAAQKAEAAKAEAARQQADELQAQRNAEQARREAAARSAAAARADAERDAAAAASRRAQAERMAAELQQKQMQEKAQQKKAAPVAAKSKTRPFKSTTHGGLPLFLGQFMFLAVAFGGSIAASTVAKGAVQDFADGVDKKLMEFTLPSKE